MDNALGIDHGRNLSSGIIPKGRYVIVSLELGREQIIEDFYAFTYKQAAFRLKQQRELLPESEFSLLAYSSLEGWLGDRQGHAIAGAGKVYIVHEPLPVGVSAIMGGDLFAESFVGHKYDLTLVSDQAGQNAVTYDGVLWARDKSAEALLARVGRDIDAAIADKL